MMNACPRWSFLAVPTLLALGCSDPVPPPAQAAVTFSVKQPVPSVNQMACPISGKTYLVGGLEKDGMTTGAPTMTDPGVSLISGESSSSISCSVSGSSSFSFSGSIHAISSEGDLIDLVFSGGSVTASAPGTVSVSVLTPQLPAIMVANSPCTVSVLGSPPQVKGGSIWANFSCDQVYSPPSNLCGLSGTIVFENCSGS